MPSVGVPDAEQDCIVCTSVATHINYAIPEVWKRAVVLTFANTGQSPTRTMAPKYGRSTDITAYTYVQDHTVCM